MQTISFKNEINLELLKKQVELIDKIAMDNEDYHESELLQGIIHLLEGIIDELEPDTIKLKMEPRADLNLTDSEVFEIVLTKQEMALAKIGEGIAKELQLERLLPNGRFNLLNGDKTALGLARTVIDIITNGGKYGN